MSKVDFYPVLDTAVRELFPPNAIALIPSEQISTDALKAHDRAYEENRFQLMLWECSKIVPGKKAPKKVMEVCTVGWKAAWEEAKAHDIEFDLIQCESFVRTW